jgi:hypothetical protein
VSGTSEKQSPLPPINTDNTDQAEACAQFLRSNDIPDHYKQENSLNKVRKVTVMITTAMLSVCAFAFQGTGTSPKAQKAPAQAAAPIQTFVGVITDGQCAVKGSHNEIMKKAKVNTRANCVKGCARRYGFVLYDPATKKVYKLSDQERPAELAARRVRIKGALNKATQTIYVSSIEPVL